MPATTSCAPATPRVRSASCAMPSPTSCSSTGCCPECRACRSLASCGRRSARGKFQSSCSPRAAAKPPRSPDWRGGAPDAALPTPCWVRELLARIKAVRRRRAPQMTDDPVEISGLRLDPGTRRVFGGPRPLALGPSEFRLLHFLMTHAERVHSRTQLLDQVWGDHVFVEERTVDVHIRRLRKALEPSGHDRLIETVRGSGYRFSANPA